MSYECYEVKMEEHGLGTTNPVLTWQPVLLVQLVRLFPQMLERRVSKKCGCLRCGGAPLSPPGSSKNSPFRCLNWALHWAAEWGKSALNRYDAIILKIIRVGLWALGIT